MMENACKSLRFNTMPVITTRFGRKRGTLECGLHDVACMANVIGEGEGRAPNSLIFFLLPSLPLSFPDVFCESLFFQNKMASPVKRSRTVALSAERVLQSLEKKVMAMITCRVAKKAIYIVICKKQVTYTYRGIKCPA